MIKLIRLAILEKFIDIIRIFGEIFLQIVETVVKKKEIVVKPSTMEV